ncbi:MAG TPA: sugar phosphate nucleotidyltransferase [Candidatus Woesebacteria bacterium]|nr:sugar phosphate nucleotidyltransferase [Candidatus Woesebacteria bacterium]
MTDKKHLYAVLLAGGGGTRLWPKSRIKTPKQFLKLTGPQSMMQIAASRINKLVNWQNIIVVTNKIYLEEVKKQLPEVKVDNIIAEPEKKDTAAAMLVGALYAKSKDEDAVIINAASDHIVEDTTEFVKVMEAAVETAAQNPYLVTVGITPSYPTSAFGYIKVGKDIKKIRRDLMLFKVDSFTEKPNLATAIAFISTGAYFWNANMYVWSAKELKAAFAKYMPDMLEVCKKLDQLNSKDFHKALPKVYKEIESISIDYAISEKADNLVLIPGDFGWNDVGDWKVVYDLGKKDLSGNVTLSDQTETRILSVNAHKNLIHTDGRLVAICGIDDLIIIDTNEILMICPKNRSQDVKKLVERLKEESKKEYL